MHWHGVLLPSGMDGVQGLNQRGIPPGETYVYEFTLRQHGTQMYHSHGDEMVQIGLGTIRFLYLPMCGIGRDQSYDFLWASAVQASLVAFGLISGLTFALEEVLLFSVLVVVRHRIQPPWATHTGHG